MCKPPGERCRRASYLLPGFGVSPSSFSPSGVGWGLSGIGFLEAGSRGKAPSGVSGERCLGDSVKGPLNLSPFAPEGGALKNLHLRGGGEHIRRHLRSPERRKRNIAIPS